MDAALSEYYYNERLFHDDLLDFFDDLELLIKSLLEHTFTG